MQCMREARSQGLKFWVEEHGIPQEFWKAYRQRPASLAKKDAAANAIVEEAQEDDEDAEGDIENDDEEDGSESEAESNEEEACEIC